MTMESCTVIKAPLRKTEFLFCFAIMGNVKLSPLKNRRNIGSDISTVSKEKYQAGREKNPAVQVCKNINYFYLIINSDNKMHEIM